MSRTSLCVLAASLLLFLAAPFFAGCDGDDDVGDAGTYYVSGDVATRLPPGHPGVVSGSTLTIPLNADPPSVRAANCFAGVANVGDIGIGSSVGVTKDFIGAVTLPVNVNLGASELGAYRIRIDVSDPSVEIDIANVSGSADFLVGDNCAARGCPDTCAGAPAAYPAQFSPAPGFAGVDDVTGDAVSAVIERADADPGNPTIGVANLCNVRFNIVGDLPAAGVNILFTVELLEDSGGNPIANTTYDGIITDTYVFQ